MRLLDGGAQRSHHDLVISERTNDMALDERGDGGIWVDDTDADGIRQVDVAGTHQDPEHGTGVSDAAIKALLHQIQRSNVCRRSEPHSHDGNNV
jgi:hypothetical protein